MAELSKRAARIVAVGKSASAGSRNLARPRASRSRCGRRSPAGRASRTDDVIRRVAAGLIDEAKRVRAQADKLDKLAGRLLRDLEE